jgi:hypothetical protein
MDVFVHIREAPLSHSPGTPAPGGNIVDLHVRPASVSLGR